MINEVDKNGDGEVIFYKLFIFYNFKIDYMEFMDMMKQK